MLKCDCYCQETEIEKYLSPTKVKYVLVSRCNGTKERDKCLCNGDIAKCDFYPEKRAQAERASSTPISRSALYDWYVDRVDGELPSWLDTLFNDFYLIPKENTNGK